MVHRRPDLLYSITAQCDWSVTVTFIPPSHYSLAVSQSHPSLAPGWSYRCTLSRLPVHLPYSVINECITGTRSKRIKNTALSLITPCCLCFMSDCPFAHGSIAGLWHMLANASRLIMLLYSDCLFYCTNSNLPWCNVYDADVGVRAIRITWCVYDAN